MKLQTVFNQQNIAFQIEDDPFEVKLRDNYAVCCFLYNPASFLMLIFLWRVVSLLT